MRHTKRVVLAVIAVSLLGTITARSIATIASGTHNDLDTTSNASFDGVAILNDAGAHNGSFTEFGNSVTTNLDPADYISPQNTVDAGCAPDPADCAAAINTAIASNTQRPLKVTFGANHPAGTEFSFATSIALEDNIAIEGDTDTHFGRPTALLDRVNLFNITGLSNISIGNFDLDLEQCAAPGGLTIIEGSLDGAAWNNVHIGDIEATDGPDSAGCFFFRSRTLAGSHLYMQNIRTFGMGRFMWFYSSSDAHVHDNIYVRDNTITGIYNSAFYADSYVEDVYIERNYFDRHSLLNPKTQHFVSFKSLLEPETDPTNRRVYVRDNVFQGNPGLSHDDPGGAADLIAMKGTEDFIVERNQFRDGGEAGITSVAGIKDGHIRHNIVERIDFAGIPFGNEALNGTNAQVDTVDVYGNDVSQTGIDSDDRVTGELPAQNIWNVKDSCVVNNFYHDTSGTGLWVFNGNGNGIYWPSFSVENVYVNGNTYSNVGPGDGSWDFVESNPATSGSSNAGFQPAALTGGTYWTSAYPDTDADGDNFGATACATETDDSDPCVPDLHSPACKALNPNDDDVDGVLNASDLCINTLPGSAIDSNGCTDNDNDGYFVDIDSSDPLYDSVDADDCIPNMTSTCYL